MNGTSNYEDIWQTPRWPIGCICQRQPEMDDTKGTLSKFMAGAKWLILEELLPEGKAATSDVETEDF